jgi:DNA-binding response OmpR family regulator
LGLYGNAATILVVDDEPQLRTAVRRTLLSSGFKVLEAPDGAQAFAIVKQHPGPIHLLITDIVLPHMSGPLLARAARRLRPELRVVYMSSHIGDPIVEQEIDNKETFLLKPFGVDWLRMAVHHALSERRRWRRVAFITKVECRAYQKRTECDSADISEGGMCLKGPGDLNPGDKLSLRFTVFDQLINSSATLVRKREKDFAVEFSGLDSMSKQVIKTYITQQP